MLAVALTFLKGISLRTWLIVGAFAAVMVWHWSAVREARNEGRAEVQVELDAAEALLTAAIATIASGERVIAAQKQSLEDCIGERQSIKQLADMALEETRRVGKELARTLGSKMDKLAVASAKPECEAVLATDVDALCGL